MGTAEPRARAVQAASSLTRRSIRAFAITETELKLMAAAANTGLNRIPAKGYRTPAAMGTPKAL